MTTAKYYTPSGRSIQKTGIDPDILVEQAELKKVDNPSSRKESDLRGAIDNDQEDSNRNEDKSTSKKDDEKIDDYQLTRALALEHAEDGIRVNAVAPGEVNTPMIRSGREKPPTVDELQKLADETIPMKRLAVPEEIAEVVLFLASEKSSYMTGSIVPVDAGYTAR